jgi:hypothetical protein
MVFSYDNNSGGMNLYINGVLAASGNHANNRGTPYAASSTIGAASDGSGHYFPVPDEPECE